MKIKKILIEDKILEKILYTHNVKASEIREVLIDSPLILKTRDDRYIVIGHGENKKFITIVFELIGSTAFIITAYPSSDSQRKLYKRKRT